MKLQIQDKQYFGENKCRLKHFLLAQSGGIKKTVY